MIRLASWRAAVCAAILLCALAGVGGALWVWRASVRLTNPPEYRQQWSETSGDGPSNPSAYGLQYENVEFPAVDGATLRGWLIPADAGNRQAGVVAAHGRSGDRRAYLAQLPFLHQLGLTVLLFDSRENGASDGANRGMSLGYRESQDVSAAARFLRARAGVAHVGVIGQSLGAASAIIAAAQDQSIDAVVAESAIASFDQYMYDLSQSELGRLPLAKMLPPSALPNWWTGPFLWLTAQRISIPHVTAAIDVIGDIAPRPILLIHGTGDTAVRFEHSQRLYERAGDPKELWLASGVEHGQAFDAANAEYEARVSDFFRRALLS